MFGYLHPADRLFLLTTSVSKANKAPNDEMTEE